MITVTTADAGLVSHQCGHLLELLAVHVAVAVQVEHSESNLEMTLRCYANTQKMTKQNLVSTKMRSEMCVFFSHLNHPLERMLD